jgi:predicted RNase H-like nuclease (RuvC/YqgF family)
MNANELADCLDMRVVYGLPLAEAAAMLRVLQRTLDGDKRLINLLYEKERQQAEQIAELKAYNTKLHGIEHDLEMKVSQLQAEIEALKAKTQEPDCYGDGNVYRGVRSKDSEIQTIHVNSTAKTLTDEEIADCADEAKIPYDEHKGFYAVHSNGSWVNIGEYLENFARAILRKAQER